MCISRNIYRLFSYIFVFFDRMRPFSKFEVEF
jgi:hypothetical protein